jgi:PilZ domain-containing protein
VQTFGKSVHPKLDPTAARHLAGEAADAPKVAEASMPIIEALVCETHAAALLAATIASAINAFRRPDTERSERELRPYVPSEPALISVLRNHMLEADLDRNTVEVIVGFFDDLGPARAALNQYFSDANKLGDERASALHLLTLSNAWQRACEAALDAVRQLHGYLGRLPAQYTSNSKAIMGVLQNVAHGGSPCLDANGKIALPDLPQKRLAARRTICQPCTITYNRITAQAFVRDVSAGGFGLERVPQLAPKTLVLIELPSGRRFTGVVAWCKDSTAGIRFSRPLLPNDPLLSS